MIVGQHGAMWLVLGVVAGAVGIGLIAWCVRRPALGVRATPTAVDVPAIKARYISTIDDLQREFGAHHLDERELHHRLSRTVREFAADLGAPGAVAMTASLLSEAGLDGIARAVSGYQEPQFKERAVSDPRSSCAVAKVVVEQW